MAEGGADRNPIEVLSEEFLERIRRGEAVTPEEYAQKHPDLADEILTLFPALLMMEELADETSDRTGSIAGEAGTIAGATAGRLGEFRLLREVGRGGMGVVYEAEQESLGRRVALKVLPTGALTDVKQIRRFEREARSAARLHHTNIVPIFGVGEHEGTHYYVMQFIQGQGLDAVLDELKKLRDARAAKSLQTTPPEYPEKVRVAADIAQSLITGRFAMGAGAQAFQAGASATEAWTGAPAPLVPTSATHSDASSLGASSTSGVSTLSETDRRFAQGVARIGVQVAEALAHAHGQGILHRDIKPSNLLLDREGNVWVTDFGLAKATGGEDLTHTGDIIGTVRYMAPERFQGAGDARADLYALGLTLYELLALRPAFNETDRASLVRQVTQEDPPRLRRLNRHVPLDLETIIHKVIARDPGQRYATARALSDDLQRFLDGRPILARRVSTTERLYRWSRRNPALAAAVAVVALLLVATTVGSIVAAARFRNIAGAARLAARDAEEAQKQADASRRLAEDAGREAEARRVEADDQRHRAQTNLAESQASLALARKAVDDSFTKVSESALLNVPGLRPLRRDLLESALAFYEEFLRRGGDEPGVLADLAATQSRVGQILGDLSQQDKARVALRRAVELYDKTLAARPNDTALLERQSEVWHRLGDLDYRTDERTANAAFRKAIAIRERLAAEHPADPRFRMALSRSFNGVAITTSGAEQLDAYRRSLELRLKLAGEIPDDPDLLHGVSESFLNLGIRLTGSGHREEALELARRSIDYGRAGLARRPHDLEFASDLGMSYTQAASSCWQLGRREEALAISADGVAYLRKLSGDNPDVRSYRDALANALGAHGRYLRDLGRTEQAVSFGRQAAETLETKPDPDVGAMATATFYRAHLAALLAGDPAAHDVKSWPEAARHEADVAVADLKGAVARGLRRADLVRADPVLKLLLSRDDVKSLVAEMERPPAKPSLAKPPATAVQALTTSPLGQPGRLEEDRFLGELAIGLLQGESGEPDQVRARLETMLARIEARRKSSPDSPVLKASAQSIRVRIGEQLWKAGELAEARRLWDEVLSPLRRLPAGEEGRQSALTRFAPAMQRITDLFAERGLWEQAALYDGYYRAGNPEARYFRCFDSGLLAVARGDVAAYRDIAVEGVNRLAESENSGSLFNALRTATLSPEGPVSPEKLVEMGKRLVSKERTNGMYGWYRIALGNALLRAGRDKEALAALEEDSNGINGKAVVALIHAHAGRPEQARRWLKALDRDLEQYIRQGHLTFGALRQPHYWAVDVLRADLLRREAYALLGVTAPELRALRLLRGDSLLRLDERKKAEAEFTAAVAGAPDDVAALLDRARTFESLGVRDRADLDLAEAARRKPDDPRPWVARGKLLAERGLGSEADAAYARAALLAPGRLDPFLEAGWWVVGPYPEDMTRPQPPETNPDPARPGAGESGLPLRWKPASVNEDRYIDLGPYAGRPSSSVYAMTHLASDRERTALFCLDGGDRLRVWLNGCLVFEKDQPHTNRPGPDFLVPATLRAGRNTLLVRVSHRSGGHGLRLRAADFELDRAYLLADFGRWAEAADFFDRAGSRGKFLGPWPKARQIELLAALGDRDRCLRAATRLADWDGPVRPDPYEVALALGMMPNEVVSPERLIDIARQGIAVKPAEAWRKLPLGLALYRAGRFREARDHLTAHVPDAAHQLGAPIQAMARWRLGDKDEARKALARTDGKFVTWCRERSGGRGSAWLNWWFDGPQLVALRREAHALIDGKAPDDRAALAKVRAEMGNLIDDRDSPTWAYDLALRLEPGNVEYRKALAARLIELGRLADAEPLLSAIVEGKTKEPQAWVDRGLLLAQSGLPDRAAADFGRALELLPEDFAIWGSRTGLCRSMAAQPAAYDLLLTRRPSDALLWYIRAEQHLMRREYKAAVADFGRGGEPPATTEFAYVYAAALLLAREDSSYRDYVIRLANRHGDESEPFTLYVLARLAALAERPAVPPDRIVAWANRAVQRARGPHYFHVQAVASLRAGDNEAASESVESSRRLRWNAGGQALNDLVVGMIQNRQGRAALAREQFERVKAVFDRTPSASLGDAVLLTDWLEFQVLRPQIEGPLLDTGFPADPFAR